MQQTRYKCKQGETFRRVLVFSSKSTGLAIDLTGWAFRMDVRVSAATAVLASATITPRDQSGADKGKADLVIAKTATAAMPPQEYYYDICADTSGERRFYLEGIFEIEEAITRG